MTDEIDIDEMNSKVNRIRTFYINENINSVNKLKFVEKGLYVLPNREISCYKCDLTFNENDNGYIAVSIYFFIPFFFKF